MSTLPEDFSGFYSDDKLGFDYTLVQMCYEKYKSFFRGSIALECGPATGYMTRLLKNDFEKLHIVEGSKTLIEKIPDYTNVIKFNSLFENFDPPVKYDTIVLNHILEHIQDPISLLNKMQNWLNNDGVMIVGVPNAKSFHRLAAVKMGLLNTEFELNSRDKELGHYRVYDLDLLKSQVIESGFKIINEGGVFLKFLSNNQIDTLLNLEIVKAYYELSEAFKENCALIFVVMKKQI